MYNPPPYSRVQLVLDDLTLDFPLSNSSLLLPPPPSLLLPSLSSAHQLILLTNKWRTQILVSVLDNLRLVSSFEDRTNDTKDVEDEVDEDGEEVEEEYNNKQKRRNGSTQRNLWLKLQDTWIVHGEEETCYPWLEDDLNQKDKCFISLLYLQRPYKVSYGEKNAIWKQLETQLAEQFLFCSIILS